ncbi:NAD(+) synthase [Candidatus Pelagibacter ubique]|jgi:NAD+ synthase|uniref:NH(3)-dependent NAD(+) synthetase n=1 Tax=Pelagibacter ubique (strain HTCC1002) TaxID=314261 RepID=Q1UZK0_PELU1|nr:MULTISPECIES: NAD(+) synthase [Pelagibacter]EAS84191.1 NH(3)-dependent NAD+ synthetase NadE [Candidatus Pelagibacter ubique HTCC1002]MDA7443875.1 NAD(+) synthase [Candidatus Pelagibacter ubique]MDA7477058.1 NAD(+) synthase [Candidatus Pelagibacter ubique]MDA8832421.1 NAD(+) synthase [Candidatus Pelagibacter bacterium]MDA8833330.1 NAD(+) synthase [Candidatus Pelagibacter bacterium]
MKPLEKAQFISNWIKDYVNKMPSKAQSLIIGISGGIDSSVSSTLSAMTGIKTIVLSMPIKQKSSQHDLSLKHQEWLVKNFDNVEAHTINLDKLFETFESTLSNFDSELGMANSRARIRMTTLYQVAAANKGIVVGTGNKVEDFGVGFYTKYGDGGVDISPIADCNKSEVWEIGKSINILQEIIDAAPTDGLWDDGRTDEGQLGLKYEELEEAMNNVNSINREKYEKIRKMNLHKMEPIPVCKIPN